jgi:hypothetical protein
MMLQQKSVAKRTQGEARKNPLLRGGKQTDLRSPVECLLRDVALVLHATEVVRRAMEVDQGVCSTAS